MKKTCPFNFAGSKSVYAELFDIEQPVADLFGGGGGFWSNVKSNDVLVNDVCSPLVRFQKKIYESSDEEFESIISAIRTTTDSVRTKDDYEKLRHLFNQSKDDVLFMCVLSCCTNNLIRFNLSGKFNQTWGQRMFNSSMETKLRDFRERIKNKKVEFHIGDFEKIDTTGRILFVDPPYLISSAGYNTSWTIADEKRLYKFLNGKDFILTNFLFRGDVRNTILERFIKESNLFVSIIKEGQMKAQKDNSTFQEVAVSNLPFAMGVKEQVKELTLF